MNEEDGNDERGATDDDDKPVIVMPGESGNGQLNIRNSPARLWAGRAMTPPDSPASCLLARTRCSPAEGGEWKHASNTACDMRLNSVPLLLACLLISVSDRVLSYI